MKYYTNEGKTYCVVGTVEGTVTSASGVVIASFSANEQNYFTAPAGGFVTISDDTAIVTPVFNLAPSALVGESGGGDTPSGGKNTLYYNFAEDGTYGIEGDLSGLTNGESMFYNSKKLTSFSADLSKLTDGSRMFYYSTLESFSGDLSSLSNGFWMFYDTPLTSFNGDLTKLTEAQNMFYNSDLESFSGDLSSLSDGKWMFMGTPLTSFRGDLSSLTDGQYMFQGCKLDLESVQNIANTINTISSGTLDIGISSSIRGNADLATALEAIRAKGWTVTEYYA